MERSATAPRHTGLAIAGLAAIPVASVSAVALLGDIASGTDASRLGPGLAALVVGVVSGLGVLRVVSSVRAGLVTLAGALVHWAGEAVDAAVDGATGFVPALRTSAALVVVVPAAVGRRGPPAVLR